MYTTKNYKIENNREVYMDGCGKYQTVAIHPPNIFVVNCSNGEMVNVIDELNKLEMNNDYWEKEYLISRDKMNDLVIENKELKEIIKMQDIQKEVDNKFFNKVVSNKKKCMEENEQLKKEMEDLQNKDKRKNKKICSLKDKINELIMTNDIWKKKYLKLRDKMNDGVVCNLEFDNKKFQKEIEILKKDNKFLLRVNKDKEKLNQDLIKEKEKLKKYNDFLKMLLYRKMIK